jgi:hypothetical protein
VNDARPVRFQLGGQWFEVYVLTEPHHLPIRRRRTLADDLVRIWISCPRCRHRARKLYTFPLVAGSPALADLRCRKCHSLVYQSQHCCKNRWRREIARPLKRLLRRRECLVSRKPSAKVLGQLEQVDQWIWIMRQRAAAKNAARRRSKGSSPTVRLKRTYRDLSLLSV